MGTKKTPLPETRKSIGYQNSNSIRSSSSTFCGTPQAVVFIGLATTKRDLKKDNNSRQTKSSQYLLDKLGAVCARKCSWILRQWVGWAWSALALSCCRQELRLATCEQSCNRPCKSLNQKEIRSPTVWFWCFDVLMLVWFKKHLKKWKNKN